MIPDCLYVYTNEVMVRRQAGHSTFSSLSESKVRLDINETNLDITDAQNSIPLRVHQQVLN
jgi:hypothetical protein